MHNAQEPADMYDTYIRTADGQTYYAENFKEGMEQFLSDEGYRITFTIEGVEIILRKNTEVDEDTIRLDNFIENQTSVQCAVTIRR